MAPQRRGKSLIRLATLALVAVVPCCALGVTPQHVATYFADVPADGDSFGRSVALEDGVALIGAYLSPRGLIDSGAAPGELGAAFVFDTQSNQLTHVITDSDFADPEVALGLGASVALDRGVAAIGSVAIQSSVPFGQDIVRFYDTGNSSPRIPKRSRDRLAPQGFGSSLALHDGVALIGVPLSLPVPNQNTTVGGGLAELSPLDHFSLNGVPMEPPAVLSPDATPQYLQFGSSVALNDRYAVVGSAVTPAVYVYDAVTQQQLHRIDVLALIPPLNNNDSLSIAIEGDLAVVGVPTASKAFLFNLSTGHLERELVPDGGSDSFEQFGRSVAIDAGRVVVGEPLHSENLSGGVVSGTAYVFDAETGNQIVELIAPEDPGVFSPSLYGVSVAIDGDEVLVGSLRGGPTTGTGPYGHGGAVLFRLIPEPTAATTLFALSAIFAVRSRRERS